jgi:hypothetical protein
LPAPSRISLSWPGMSTTALFAEILLVGCQALVWLLLFCAAVLGPEPSGKSFAWVLAVNPALTLPVGLALAYAVGILVDRGADSLLEARERRWRDECMQALRARHPDVGAKARSFGQIRLMILRDSKNVGQDLEYIRSRIRIARASVLNLPLICVTGAAVAARTVGSITWSQRILTILLLLVIGACAGRVAWFVWCRISTTYHQRVREAYAILAEQPARPAAAEPQP